MTHLSVSVHHTSQWGCTTQISVGVYVTHLSGSVHHTSQWGCTSHISVGVYITHPVMVHIDEFRAVSNLLMWLLRPKAGQHYSGGANSSAIVDVLRVVKSAPHVVPAWCLIPQTREFTILAVFTRCSLYMRLLPRVTPM